MDDGLKTILSAGLVIRRALLEDEHVRAITEDVFPVVTNEGARMPYIVYQRDGLDQDANKGRGRCDRATISVECYTEGYGESVALAEAVRNALDGLQMEDEENGLSLRSCVLDDASEGWVGEAIVQRLTFTVRI